MADTYRLAAQHDAFAKEIKGSTEIYQTLENIQRKNPTIPKNLDSLLEMTAPLDKLATKISLEELERDAEAANEKKRHYLSKSLEAFLNYMQMVQVMLKNIDSKGDFLRIVAEDHNFYDRGIIVCHELHQLTGNDQLLDKAFEITEKSNSLFLLKGMEEKENIARSPFSMEEEKEISELENKLWNLDKQRLSNTYNEKLEEKYLTTLINYEKRIEDLENKYLNYNNDRYGYATVSLSQVKNEILQENQAMIKYFVGKDRNYIMVISKDSMKLLPLYLPKDMPEKIKTFIQVISQWSDTYITEKNSDNSLASTYTILAHELYQILIEPIKAETKLPEKIIISPSSYLNYVPFEALIQNMPDSIGRFKHYPYLVKDYKISYCHSATHLKKSLEQIQQKSSKGILAIAPSFSTSSLGRLYHNLEESNRILTGRKGTLLKGNLSSKEDFLEHAPKYRLLHFATHAVSHDSIGNLSFLAFNGDNPDSLDSLFVPEIRNLPLTAQMVVMSACRTGDGELKKGEGVVSLSHAFSYAGIPAVISTLWNSDGASSKKIMPAFYDNLQNKLPKDEALRAAQLSYIEECNGHDESHPFFWAAYIPYGNMLPLDIEPSHSNLWIYMAIIVLSFLIIPILIKNHKGNSINLK